MFHFGTKSAPASATFSNLKRDRGSRWRSFLKKVRPAAMLRHFLQVGPQVAARAGEIAMEHILVCMTPRHGAFGALGRAVALARRIAAKVSVLFVTDPPEGQATPPLAEVEARRQLRLLVERARSEGVAIEWFVAEGNYEEEVIRFANDRKVTLLVAETTDAEGRQSERETQSLRQILHRVSCRVERVSPRKDETATQPKGKAT